MSSDAPGPLMPQSVPLSLGWSTFMVIALLKNVTKQKRFPNCPIGRFRVYNNFKWVEHAQRVNHLCFGLCLFVVAAAVSQIQ